MVAYFRLLRIAAGHYCVIDLPVEIAPVTHHRLRHLRPQCRIYPTHEHRLFAKGFRHPFRELVFLSGKGIPHPQAVRKRCPIIAAAEKRTVWSCGEGGLDLGLRLHEILVGNVCGNAAVVALVGNFRKADEELVVVGDVLRRGTSRENKAENNDFRYHPHRAICFFAHGFSSFLKISLICWSERRQMKPTPYSCV